MDLIQDLLDAAAAYDREATESAAEKLVAHAQDAGKPYENERRLKRALTSLRDNRWFDLLRTTGEGLMRAGDMRASVRRLHAQGLIDTGAIGEAIRFLEKLIKDCAGEKNEHDEARGLLGRAWKQAYVTGDDVTAKALRNAVKAYYEPYDEDPTNYWHGINAVACLARAKRDGLKIQRGFPAWRDLAESIRDDIADLPQVKLMHWDCASAAEASWALGDREGAIEWLGEYVSNGQTDAFAVAATLRQFQEVWRLTQEPDDPGAALLHILQAKQMKWGGGLSIDIRHAARSLKSMEDDDTLQAVLGDERYKDLEWYRRGLVRACAVCKIKKGATGGTGFVINASSLDPELTGQLLVTNNHVIPGFIPNYGNAKVTFEALDNGEKEYAIDRMLWTSPTKDLDVSILRLTEEVKEIESYPVYKPPLPELAARPRVYVIGHPDIGALSFSLSDNLLTDHEDPRVHYRAPTTKGSSGSPVFDSDWLLLALHRAGSAEDKIKMLHGSNEKYAANEGMFFPTIASRFAAERSK